MSSSTAALSKTLKTITLTKFKELEKQRKTYEHSKSAVLEAANNPNTNSQQRVQHLLLGVQKLFSSLEQPINVQNIRRWLEQSQYDSSIPDQMFDLFEAQLRSQLDVHTRRMNLAGLYSNLLTEWLNTTTGLENSTAENAEAFTDGSFEMLEKGRLKDLTDKFESVVFTPLDTNENEIFEYLDTLFQGDARAKSLSRLRDRMEAAGILMNKTRSPFEEQTIRWCLKGLLANDLLRDDKKAILKEFLTDAVARKEICDVLNMKFVDLKSWDWDCDGRGLPVEPRPQLNGKYRIMMDEDILDAIFLHYIGTFWAVKSKHILHDTAQSDGIRKTNIMTPNDTMDRRKYFLGPDMTAHERSKNVQHLRQEVYREDFFLSQLPSTVAEGAGGYDDEESDVEEDHRGWGAAANKTKVKKTPKEVKQELLRLLATEVQLHMAIYEEVAVVQSDFKWFGTSIPHSTVFAVLRYMGVDEVWISFFKRFLEAPLDMSPSSAEDLATRQGRVRKRGVPMAHALEKFFGEAVLFFLDLAVGHEADMLLYRFHDDLWLVGQPASCAAGWEEIKKFSKVMGLELNDTKTGSVYLTNEDLTFENSVFAARLPQGPVTIGFLNLDPKTWDWVIDQKQVIAHVKQLSKQLAKSTSILTWVQTWNSCIGRFFSHTFGEPANCFGRAHVDTILETHQRMQEVLFPGSNVCQYLKDLIEERFGVKDIPDAVIFLPEALGGLGVRNPFISPFMVRENVVRSPSKLLDDFFDDEQLLYEDCKRDFEEMSVQERKRRLMLVYTDAYGETMLPDRDGQDLEIFMSKSEFIRNRMSTSPGLRSTYEELMRVPEQMPIGSSERVDTALHALAQAQPELKREDKKALREEMRWILQTYENDLVETCGGMSIVEKNLLPLGILTILRKKKVAWQMVL